MNARSRGHEVVNFVHCVLFTVLIFLSSSLLSFLSGPTSSQILRNSKELIDVGPDKKKIIKEEERMWAYARSVTK